MIWQNEICIMSSFLLIRPANKFPIQWNPTFQSPYYYGYYCLAVTKALSVLFVIIYETSLIPGDPVMQSVCDRINWFPVHEHTYLTKTVSVN